MPTLYAEDVGMHQPLRRCATLSLVHRAKPWACTPYSESRFLGTAPLEKGETATAIGGETAVLEVTAQGRTWPISPVHLPPQHRAFLMEKRMPAIRATVPEALWRTLEARRQTYHHAGERG